MKKRKRIGKKCILLSALVLSMSLSGIAFPVNAQDDLTGSIYEDNWESAETEDVPAQAGESAETEEIPAQAGESAETEDIPAQAGESAETEDIPAQAVESTDREDAGDVSQSQRSILYIEGETSAGFSQEADGYLMQNEPAAEKENASDASDEEIMQEDELLLASYGSAPKGIWISGMKEMTYTGKEVTFDVHVYDEKLLLAEGTDYTVSYKNNIEAAASDATNAPVLIIKGQGNYQGQIQARFTIKPMTLLSAEIEAADLYEPYTGEVIYPLVEVVHNGKVLVNKQDYIYDVRTNKNAVRDAKEAGNYNILITGIGNYSGTRTIKLTVTAKTLITEAEFTPVEPVAYTGAAIRPELQLACQGRQLKAGADYTVEYKNNINAGFATLKITGKGDFAGVRYETFEITGVQMSEVAVYDLQESYYYTGSEQKPSVRLVYSRGSDSAALSTILNARTDYTVSYENNIKVGLATVTFEGKGRYTGTIVRNFEIVKYDFNSDDGNLRISSEPLVVYQKGGCRPAVRVQYNGNTLKEGEDYTISYKNIHEAGNTETEPLIVVTGKGNYTGSLTRNFIINRQDISKLLVLAPDKVYSKVKDKPYYNTMPQIFDLDEEPLSYGTDFRIVSYKYKNRTILENGMVRLAGEEVQKTDRMPIGTVLSITVQGVHNYQGTVSATYKITTQNMSRASITVSTQYYTGYAVTPGQNQMTVKIGGRILRNSDYEIVSYSNNVECGTATVRIHGTGSYGGYASGKFTIKVRDMKGKQIYFNGNGATQGKMKMLMVSALETDAVLYQNAYSRKGYEFDGWNTREDGSGTSYKDGASISLPADKNGILLTLYAQWKPQTFTITYYLNGGTNVSTNPGFYRYNTDSVVFQPPVRTGYDFKGWYATRNFNKKTTEIKPGTMKNITLYAKWKLKAPVIQGVRRLQAGRSELSFTAVAGAKKYVIYRAGSLNGTYERIGSTKSTAYVDEKAKSGKTYYYKVRAYSGERTVKGYSDYSDAVGSSN